MFIFITLHYFKTIYILNLFVWVDCTQDRTYVALREEEMKRRGLKPGRREGSLCVRGDEERRNRCLSEEE